MLEMARDINSERDRSQIVIVSFYLMVEIRGSKEVAGHKSVI